MYCWLTRTTSSMSEHMHQCKESGQVTTHLGFNSKNNTYLSLPKVYKPSISSVKTKPTLIITAKK